MRTTISTAARDARYVGSILDLHETLCFRRLPTVLDASATTFVADHGNGTTTVAARTADLPRRYLLGIAGFRMAQYLRIGYASGDVAVTDTLFGERIDDWHPDDRHCLTLDNDTGRILGYVALVRNGDPEPRRLRDSRRRPYPVEQAHRIDLFDVVGAPTDMTTDRVWEVKRFVHARCLHDRTRRYRVTLELLLALTRAVATSPRGLALVGDAEAQVARRHLLLMGLELTVVAGTSPRLPDTDLMWPMYVTRDCVEPFYARLPDLAELGRMATVLEKACRMSRLIDAANLIRHELSGHLEVIAFDDRKAGTA